MIKFVDLTTDQLKKIPGYTSKISGSRWKGKIDGLLYDLQKDGLLKRKAWLTEEDGSEILLVTMEVEVNNVRRRIGFKLEPVMVRHKKHKGGKYSPWVFVEKEELSWKLFHDLLERKIAAIRLGMTEVQYEFMQYITRQLPTGEEETLADFIDNAIQEGDIGGLALEDKSRVTQ